MKIEELGKGLIAMAEELRDLWTRETMNEENRHTFKQIGVGGDMSIVGQEGDATIVQNKHGDRFKVTGKGLSRRITKIFTAEEIEKINRECPPAND